MPRKTKKTEVANTSDVKNEEKTKEVKTPQVVFEEYIVKRGDSLQSICAEKGLKLNEVIADNNLHAGSKPVLGTVLKIRK
jgi:LysM repeat protein